METLLSLRYSQHQLLYQNLLAFVVRQVQLVETGVSSG